MNRYDIIRMARKAGFVQHYTRPQDAIVRKGYALSGELKGYKAAMQDLIHFAALVAAAERERNAQIADAHASCEGIAQVIAAEIRGQA